MRAAIRGLLSAMMLASCSNAHPPAAPPDMMTPSASALLTDRPYTATVPPGYTDSKSWPLLIVLAGYGGTSADSAMWLGFTQLAADQGAFLATPTPPTIRTRCSPGIPIRCIFRSSTSST